jgi:hypothetical protein
MALTKVDFELVNGFIKSSPSTVDIDFNMRFNVRGSISSLNNTGGTITLDFASSNVYDVKGGTATIQLSGIGQQQTVYVILNSTGSSYTITWASSGNTIRWGNSTAPVLTNATANTKKDLISFIRINNELFGSYILNT